LCTDNIGKKAENIRLEPKEKTLMKGEYYLIGNTLQPSVVQTNRLTIFYKRQLK